MASTADMRLAYSPGEAAEILGVSRSWVHHRISDGTIPAAKVAGRRLIRHEVLDELLAKLEGAA